MTSLYKKQKVDVYSYGSNGINIDSTPAELLKFMRQSTNYTHLTIECIKQTHLIVLVLHEFSLN